MTELVPGPDSPPPPVEEFKISESNDSTDPRDMANALADFRNKRDAANAEALRPKQPQQKAAPEKAAPAPVQDSPPETAQAEVATDDTQPAEELPPIEAPRSWSKEWKEEFASYPREVQEKIAQREQDRDAGLRRSQNEAAEQRKAYEAKLAEAEKVRQEYEAALPALAQTLAQSGEFADIKTQADVEKLANEDWARFARYQAHLMKVGHIEQQMKQTQERQQQEYRSKWDEFANSEDRKFIEAAPEMADKERGRAVADKSVAILKEIGFSDQDLGKLWNGEASLSLRDHRAQLLLLKAAKYDEAVAAAKTKVAAKPVPPVQKPGSANQRAGDEEVRVKDLQKQLDKSGSLEDAVAFITARRQATR